ncbi:glyoxalase [Hoyosella rhizosphaerae]|uniref:Glyoxalase n=1 Tax=Hoyosella rhizosphaerae TaxID=1755582 RepID=A0A916UC81_9ACTN|nr:VOC family protein [Hoyosella rhizosphaerae]MBN4925734.1 glyoxalase [Hoyosella rhizosphaerae]GGC68356.1 glyoxalase [Hoyosella rhizosphaerae]
MTQPVDDRKHEFPRPGAVPYLTVSGAQEAVNWYVAVFDARLLGTPITMDDGRIGHAELQFGEGVIYLAEEFPEMGLTAPRTGTASVSLLIPVEDPDLVLTRAREAGGRVERWTYESHGQRNATLVDPFGHRWMLSAPLGGQLHQGDIAGFTWCAQDVSAAVDFYTAVLGWEVEKDGDSYRVANSTVPLGVEGGAATSALRCCFAVGSIDETVKAVVSAGGSQLETDPVMCRSVAGEDFELSEISGNERRPAINGNSPGDPAYITFETTDPDAFRTFFGTVLGWEFDGSEDKGGFEMVGVHPMTGMTRAPATTVVPMWRVDDAVAAAQRVTENGGEILAGPEVRDYGVSVHCRDNQGGRFYLGS